MIVTMLKWEYDQRGQDWTARVDGKLAWLAW